MTARLTGSAVAGLVVLSALALWVRSGASLFLYVPAILLGLLPIASAITGSSFGRRVLGSLLGAAAGVALGLGLLVCLTSASAWWAQASLVAALTTGDGARDCYHGELLASPPAVVRVDPSFSWVEVSVSAEGQRLDFTLQRDWFTWWCAL